MTAGRNVKTTSKSWNTPEWIIDSVRNVFHGTIDLDPCSNEYSQVRATVEYMLPKNDGLVESWDYKHIFVNPPYGNDTIRKTRIIDWFKKVVDSFHKGSEIIMLVPVSTNTKHWKEYVYKEATAICFLYDTRFKFWIDGFEEKRGAPMPVCILYYGSNIELFIQEFKQYGAIIPLENISIPN